MHVIQHIEGRDLLFRLAVSEAELAQLVTAKVMAVLEEMQAKGLPIVEFQPLDQDAASRSITKLLAKKETVAAQVYDKTRFRIVTQERRRTCCPSLYFLTQRLFPFNFVVPGRRPRTRCSTSRRCSREYPHFGQHADELHLDLDYEDREEREPGNEFSGQRLPGAQLRRGHADPAGRVPAAAGGGHAARGRAASRFALVEFQIVDEADRAAERAGRELARAVQAAAEAAGAAAAVARAGRAARENGEAAPAMRKAAQRHPAPERVYRFRFRFFFLFWRSRLRLLLERVALRVGRCPCPGGAVE